MVGEAAKEPKRSIKMILALATVIVVMIVVLAAFLPFMGASGSASRREMDRTTWSVIIGSMVQTNVTVLGGSPSPLIVDALRTRALSVNTVNDTDELNRSSGLVCIDCSGLTEQTLGEFTEPLRLLLQKGTPLILVNDTERVLARIVDGQNVSHVGAVPTDNSPIAVRALKNDPLGGSSGSLDLGGRADDQAQLAEALSHAYDWSADRLENRNASGIAWESRQIYEAYSYSYYSGDLYEPYGRFAISNSYIRTVWNTTLYPEGEEDWYVHYRTESDPGYGTYNNDFRTKSMTISASFDGEAGLHGYYPSTAYGIDSVEIHLSPNADDYLGHWEYGIRDVKVLDHSNFGVDKVSLSHELDASKEVSTAPYTAEPGVLLSIDKNTGFSFQEDYVLEWQRPSFFVWEGSSANLTVSGTFV